MNPIAKRTVAALATAGGVVAALVWAPFAALLPVAIVLAALVQVEFCQMAAKKYEVATVPAVAAGVLWLVGRFYFNSDALVPLLFALAVIVLLRGCFERPLEAFAVTVLSFFYVPFLLSYFIMFLSVPISGKCALPMLLYVAAIVKVSDMGGFAFGLSFGKHRMCPEISPKKSWEGFAGSVFASCLVSCSFIPLTHFGWGKALAFGVAAAACGTLGDLVESRFKRDCGVKDSATFMPAGMGGFLDMFDSLIFAPAIFWGFL